VSEFYDGVAQLAADLLAEYGGPVTLLRQASANETPRGSLPIETTVACIGAVFDYSMQASGQQDEDGGRILYGDKQLYLSPQDANGATIDPPEVEDRVIALGFRYVVKNVKTLGPAGTNCLFELNLRR
jgi:hypothetical protein